MDLWTAILHPEKLHTFVKFLTLLFVSGSSTGLPGAMDACFFIVDGKNHPKSHGIPKISDKFQMKIEKSDPSICGSGSEFLICRSGFFHLRIWILPFKNEDSSIKKNRSRAVTKSCLHWKQKYCHLQSFTASQSSKGTER